MATCCTAMLTLGRPTISCRSSTDIADEINLPIDYEAMETRNVFDVQVGWGAGRERSGSWVGVSGDPGPLTPASSAELVGTPGELG